MEFAYKSLSDVHDIFTPQMRGSWYSLEGHFEKVFTSTMLRIR